MRKIYIVQDSLNKYYNKFHPQYWTIDFNDAWSFNSEQDELLKKLSGLKKMKEDIVCQSPLG
jgi:hypothetical protein